MVFTGPEVQSWHEAVDWSRVAGAGHSLAWCLATAGHDVVDERFPANWMAMAEAGLVRGAIHLLTPHYAGRAEARHYVSTIGDPRGALTAVAVQPDGHRQDDLLPTLEQVEDFALEFDRLTDGHPLIVRTQHRWWAPRDPLGVGQRITPYLWHADSRWAYRASRTGVPAGAPAYGGWTSPTIWAAHRMQCPGIAGRCGVTMFTGDLAALSALLGLDDLVDQAVGHLEQIADDLESPASRWATWRRRVLRIGRRA